MRTCDITPDLVEGFPSEMLITTCEHYEVLASEVDYRERKDELLAAVHVMECELESRP